MIKQPLFFHQQTPTGKSLGFSALIVQDQNNPLKAKMAITFCNKKDKAFNKKIAREVLRNRELIDVDVKDIPTNLYAAHMHCLRLPFTQNVGMSWYSSILRKLL